MTLNTTRRCLLVAAALVALPLAAVNAASPERTVLITGANRGIGFEFVKQYEALGWRVIATARDPASSGDLNAFAASHPNVRVVTREKKEGQQCESRDPGLERHFRAESPRERLGHGHERGNHREGIDHRDQSDEGQDGDFGEGHGGSGNAECRMQNAECRMQNARNT